MKAANSTEGFTGEGGMVMQTMNSKALISVRSENAPDFDIEEIFGTLANEDYELHHKRSETIGYNSA